MSQFSQQPNNTLTENNQSKGMKVGVKKKSKFTVATGLTLSRQVTRPREILRGLSRPLTNLEQKSVALQ